MKRVDCRGLSQDELVQFCLESGLPKFRGRQFFEWVQQKAVQSWDEIKNISPKDKKELQGLIHLSPLKKIREQISGDGTRKYLFQLEDGESIECVLMDYDRVKSRDRRTVCVSTQVGCAVGFQVTNIVFMGMGEPLHNYEAVLKAIEILNHPKGQNIGMRRITISTSGVVPKIKQLAQDNPQVGLAVSLHSANNISRNELIPMNRSFPLEELMAACVAYTEATKRRITYEVALIAGQATEEKASELVGLIKGQSAHVNLIPVNPVVETGMARPKKTEIEHFAKILEKAGISVSVREEKGTDIDAACGQLRRQWESEKK